MPTRFICDAEGVTAFLSGEIDHHNAPAARDAIDSFIEKSRPKTLTIDFSSVSFMDSSGVGLVMGRFSKLARYGGRLLITGLSTHAYRVMQLSGIEKIAEIHRKSEDKGDENDI
jgi:stage II sporulation protein AA (anti-sigma F factor antagonist)